MKRLAELVAALVGPPLATYTGVLLADTAVPVWHEARQRAAVALRCERGGVAPARPRACSSIPADAGPARRLAVGGVVVEGALMQAMERRLGEVGEVYREGAAGKLSWAAKGLTAGGAALLATRGRRSRGAAALGGALVCAGELCLRFAVFKAGIPVGARSEVHRAAPSASARTATATKVTTLPA